MPSVSDKLLSPVRVRFAPSPTGFLHIGGVRTALYNWLFARHFGGKFLLRIEDTDTERSEEKYTQDIVSCLKWLGLDWDEAPIRQMSRMELYKQEVIKGVSAGWAYVCTCSPQKVEAMRIELQARGLKPQYDRTCREKNHSPTGEYVIRAKIPLGGVTEFDDLIRGLIRVGNAEVDDFVLIRSNGTPTYNLSCVIDDFHSHITHVIRGEDHINNTPKQIHLYQWLGRPAPVFAHLPMILGQDKKKLSKRHAAVSANAYREEGYLPHALLNFLVRLGWSHGDQEVFSMDELVQYFDLSKVQKSGAVFNKEKLLWLNGEHIRRSKIQALVEHLDRDFSVSLGESALKRLKGPMGDKVLALVQPKVKTLVEMAQQIKPLLEDEIPKREFREIKSIQDPVVKKKVFDAIRAYFDWIMSKCPKEVDENASLGSFDLLASSLEEKAKELVQTHDIKLGDLAQPIRMLLTGRLVSPGIFELLEAMPVKSVMQRFHQTVYCPDPFFAFESNGDKT